MKTANQLPYFAAFEIVNRVQQAMFLESDDDGVPVLWDADKEINGADFVSDLCDLMRQYGLAPSNVADYKPDGQQAPRVSDIIKRQRRKAETMRDLHCTNDLRGFDFFNGKVKACDELLGELSTGKEPADTRA